MIWASPYICMYTASCSMYTLCGERDIEEYFTPSALGALIGGHAGIVANAWGPELTYIEMPECSNFNE